MWARQPFDDGWVNKISDGGFPGKWIEGSDFVLAPELFRLTGENQQNAPHSWVSNYKDSAAVPNLRGCYIIDYAVVICIAATRRSNDVRPRIRETRKALRVAMERSYKKHSSKDF